MANKQDTIDNWDARLLEYPFVYAGMTVKEYEIEKEYWESHLEDIKNGTYTPLWKQKQS